MSTEDTVRKPLGASLSPTISDYLFCEHKGVGQLHFQRSLWLCCVHSRQAMRIFFSECIFQP